MNKPFTANYSSSKLYPVPVQELPGNSLDMYWCLCQWKYFLEIIWISTSSYKSPKHSLLWISYPWHSEGNAELLDIFHKRQMRAATADFWDRVASQPAVLTRSPHHFRGGPLLHHDSVTTSSHQLTLKRTQAYKLPSIDHKSKSWNWLPQPRTETTLLPELKAKPVF